MLQVRVNKETGNCTVFMSLVPVNKLLVQFYHFNIKDTARGDNINHCVVKYDRIYGLIVMLYVRLQILKQIWVRRIQLLRILAEEQQSGGL
jgi:hypothetical protein